MIVGLIPARAGSKGILGKNILPLNGKPLIEYTVQAALESELFDRLIVSSDSDEILTIAKKLGAEPWKRNATLAQDDTSMNLVIADVARDLPGHALIVLLQPTSPLRTADHIKEAHEQYASQMCAGVMSVTQVDNRLLKACVLQDGALEPIYPTANRQDLPPLYQPNGAIYIFSLKAFMAARRIPACVPYLMQPEDSIDIDTLEDFAKCECLLSARA